ncbi:MAG: permease [Muribaculaceae bacterium]|nr:permease [Muribaculaceae bacterium]
MRQFFYSFINILNEMSPYILLGFLVAGLMHVFIDTRRMAKHLGRGGLSSVIKAALLGIPLPLCSCGVLPAAVSLYRQGASKGATTSFLIATPQTGVDSITATYSLLGLPFAIIRPVAALVGSVLGGIAVYKGDYSKPESTQCKFESEQPASLAGKVKTALKYGFVDMVGSIGKWLVIGLVIAALITIAVPEAFFASVADYPLLAMIAVVVVAVPMYICATGSIPVALSLMLKGLSPGIAFVMLMAGPAANFASVIVLSKSIGRRAAFIYLASVVATAIAFGLVIDCMLPAEWFVPDKAFHMQNCHVEFEWFSTLCSVLLIVLLLYSSLKHRNTHKKHLNPTVMKKVYRVDGMVCNHCKNNVEKVISDLAGVISVNVDLSKKTVEVDGSVPVDDIKAAVETAGYDFIGDTGQ